MPADVCNHVRVPARRELWFIGHLLVFFEAGPFGHVVGGGYAGFIRRGPGGNLIAGKNEDDNRHPFQDPKTVIAQFNRSGGPWNLCGKRGVRHEAEGRQVQCEKDHENPYGEEYQENNSYDKKEYHMHSIHRNIR